MNMNWERIANSIKYYTSLNYEYVEVPWMVTESIVSITKPPNSRIFKTFNGCLVASGEQSFLEIRHDLCPAKSYQCVTPCFRDEKYDELHLPYFMKNELIHVLWKRENPEHALDKMIRDALGFFLHGKIVKTEFGFDIEIEGIEVGSFGIREHEGFRWVYGTGCAEPRLSQAYEMRYFRLDEEERRFLDNNQ